jgi:hypothetical protein
MSDLIVLSQNSPLRASEEPRKIRVSTVQRKHITRQFDTHRLVASVALKICSRPFRYRLWWTYRSDDVWKNLDCPKQAEGGVVLSEMVAQWVERNLGDVGRAA